MEPAHATTRPSSLQIGATAAASSVFLLPVVVGKLLEFILKNINPDQVDITASLAYLRPLLITSFTTLGVLLGITVMLILMLQRKQGGGAARLPWVILGVQLVLGLIYLVLQLLINRIMV